MNKTIKKYRIDIIVIASLLLFACLSLLITSLTRKAGALAVVEIDGNTVHSLPLSVDGVYSLNGGTNVLVIEDGCAYLNYSECPDHTCENTGKIRYVGETIICLPNKLSVTIKGSSDGGVDLVS